MKVPAKQVGRSSVDHGVTSVANGKRKSERITVQATIVKRAMDAVSKEKHLLEVAGAFAKITLAAKEAK